MLSFTMYSTVILINFSLGDESGDLLYKVVGTIPMHNTTHSHSPHNALHSPSSIDG